MIAALAWGGVALVLVSIWMPTDANSTGDRMAGTGITMLFVALFFWLSGVFTSDKRR